MLRRNKIVQPSSDLLREKLIDTSITILSKIDNIESEAFDPALIDSLTSFLSEVKDAGQLPETRAKKKLTKEEKIAIIQASASIGAILLILAFEQSHVISTKALSFIRK